MIELLATIKELGNSGLNLTDINDKLSSFKEVGIPENQLNNLDKSLNENKEFKFSDAGVSKEVVPLNYNEASFNKLLNNGTFDDAQNKIFAVNQDFFKQPLDVINKIEDTVSASGGEIKSFDYKDRANNWFDKNELQKETGWSSTITENISSEAEANIYKNANLKEAVNGEQISLQREDLDPNTKDNFGRTNLERVKSGLSPLTKSGETLELHHIGQKIDSPLAELTQQDHRGQGNDTILHDKTKVSEIDRNSFMSERKEYWLNRFSDTI